MLYLLLLVLMLALWVLCCPFSFNALLFALQDNVVVVVVVTIYAFIHIMKDI